jgi:hypothetical protein
MEFDLYVTLTSMIPSMAKKKPLERIYLPASPAYAYEYMWSLWVRPNIRSELVHGASPEVDYHGRRSSSRDIFNV